MSNGSSSIKKRKASDTHVDDINSGGSSAFSCGTNLSQLDRMEKIMLRMEDKCNRLEAKCNSLENILTEHVGLMHTKIDETAKSMKEHVDSLDAKIDKKFKQHQYNDMLVTNQNWEDPNPDYYQQHEWMDLGYDEDTARFLTFTTAYLQDKTIAMRKGKFPREKENDKMKGISLNYDEGEYIFADDNPFIVSDLVYEKVLPYWREFAATLKQFAPAFAVLPDGCESFFRLRNVQLSFDVLYLLKDALINKPFHELRIMYTTDYTSRDDNDGHQDNRRRGIVDSIYAIIAIVQSNKYLRKLDIEGNLVRSWQIGELCSSVRNHPCLLDLDLSNCFNSGHADEMMTSLLTNGDVRLERLVMSANNITSNVTTVLSDFLATDPPLKELDLSENNDLNDNDAALLANALRSNTSLRMLNLDGTGITDVGAESFRLVLNGDSTLNSASGSNHSCWVCLDVCDSWNMNDDHDQNNRGRKIYKLLSSRHKSMSNVQYFGDIDANVLPHMVEAMQTYAEAEADYTGYVAGIPLLPALSIVYEVMRKWDIVFPLLDLK